MPVADSATSLMDELQKRLWEVEPAAFLVSERILRRTIKNHRHPASFGLRVPHHLSYVIDRPALLEIVDAADLAAPGRELPETVILLLRPDAEEVASPGLPAALLRSWRLLFHCRIHCDLEQRIIAGKLSSADVLERVGSLGHTEFEEVRSVLLQENMLLPPQDQRSTYVEFAAFYLELRHFAPALVAHYFPTLTDLEHVDALLAEDIDAGVLFIETRPEGAADPPPQILKRSIPLHVDAHMTADVPVTTQAGAVTAVEDLDRLSARANEAARLGNVVRAAILRTQAAGQASGPRAAQLMTAARHDLKLLIERLQAALVFPDLEAIEWREVLPILLRRAARGFWTVEARLLYDLQKVCLDFEREIYSVSLVDWAVSLGRMPIKRPLPGHREVLMVKHLRNAARLLVSASMNDADRVILTQLFAAVLRRGEKRLRDHFRPIIESALDDGGLVAQNVPEHVARKKLVEELLDTIAGHGFLTMGDLRDTLSRNQVKLPDLAGVREFIVGDKLIRLNRRLTLTMGGVYHGGEIYLRWLQRFSSLAFGTRPGRFLTRYLALPFGGAFVLLEALGELWSVLHKFMGTHHGAHKSFATPTTVLVVGCFLLGLLYVAPFRHAVVKGLSWLGRGLHAVFIGAPAWLLRLPISGPILLFLQHLFKPLLPAAAAGEIALLAGLQLPEAAWITAVTFMLSWVVLNSRWGRDAQELAADWLVRGWQRFSTNLLLGLLRLVLDVFKRLLDGVERLLYTVDEALRFKSGQGRAMLVLKAGLSLIWFVVTYILRFAINLLIEPQINPIKHFPVVTVSHKLILPLAFPPGRGQPSPLAELLLAVFPLPVREANAVAASIVWGIPGIFGFLVWELKENWRLYEANRSRTLRPVMVGSHGESMVRLLRPGFHSGTIPKLFARLRRAERRGRRRAARRQLDALHHVEESISRFAEREFVQLLEQSHAWGGLRLETTHVRLATNRVRIDFGCAYGADGILGIQLDLISGRLVAHVVQPGCFADLTAAQQTALANALAGFFKLSGVQGCEGALDGAAPAITWSEWVRAWEDDHNGHEMRELRHEPEA